MSTLSRKKGPDCQAPTDSSLFKTQLAYLPGQVQQVGTGPLFSLVLIGAAAARQVQAAATTRIKVLTARVMVFLLHAGSLGAETLVAGL